MPATDTFPVSAGAPGFECPAYHAFAISKNDSTDLAYVTRAIYVGGVGDIVVDLAGGETSVAFSGVPAGTVLPIRATRVRSTGTTATNMVGLY